jgi:hypothetical protein
LSKSSTSLSITAATSGLALCSRAALVDKGGNPDKFERNIVGLTERSFEILDSLLPFFE